MFGYKGKTYLLVIAFKNYNAGDEIFFTYNFYFDEMPNEIKFKCDWGYQIAKA